MIELSVGRLEGITRRDARRAPMEEIETGEITLERGLAGDHKGPKFPRRQITVLAIEDWQAALDDLTDLAGPVVLPWTARRANLLVSGVRLPRARGAQLQIGAVSLEVTAQTVPCRRMDEAHQGLLRALHPDWRGGVTCRVLMGGTISIGDGVRVTASPAEHVVRLPG